MITSTQVQAESIWIDKEELLNLIFEHKKGASWEGVKVLDALAMDINALDEFHMGIYKVVKQKAM